MTPPRWEYRVVSFYLAEREDSCESRANALGAAGWELVAIDRQEQWVFKRPLAPVETAAAATPPRVVLPTLSKDARARLR